MDHPSTVFFFSNGIKILAERIGGSMFRKAESEGRGEGKREMQGENRPVKEGSGDTEEWLEVMVDRLVEHFVAEDSQYLNRLERGLIGKEQFLAQTAKYLLSQGVAPEQRLQVMERFERFLWSYGILDPLIADPQISDIRVLSAENVRVKRLGKRESLDLHFHSARSFQRFVERIAIKNRVNISDQNALQSFTDKDSSKDFILRFHISTGFVNSTGGPYLHIRKIPKQKYSLKDLIRLGMLNEKSADLLKTAVTASDGILFAGKGGSGKTTLMNTLIDLIPLHRSGLVIQENEEMFTKTHPDLMFQHVVGNSGEGKITYGLQDLARNGLLMDLDYFVIGEIKGGEALYLLNAAYTGHKCWASVHGASAKEAMDKLVDYIKYASDYSREDALRMLLHLDTVVFLEEFQVKEIVRVAGYEKEEQQYIYEKLYETVRRK